LCEQDIRITGASTLDKGDVERMVKEADKFAGEDKKKREAVDTKNQVSKYCAYVLDALVMYY
jgi:heat shock 70kDa protein 1/2/6/8